MLTAVEIKWQSPKLGHQRVLKLRGDAQQIFVNGEFSGGSSGFWDYTIYVNPYMVVRPEGHYTKHIYVNSQRIASKIGNPEDYEGGDPTVPGSSAGKKVMLEEVVEENFTELFGSIPEIEPAADESLGMSHGGSGGEPHQYWFTSDHLGSSAFVTDASGVAIQHLEYMAFGEVFVDQRRTGFGTPYKFNAKELDCESGYYYYEARYYDPRMARFLSVDPLAGEMPAWGSYTYTFNNPVRLVDPTGMGPEESDWYPEYDANTCSIYLVKEAGDNESSLKEWANGVFSDSEVSNLYGSLEDGKIDMSGTFIGDFAEGFKADESDCQFNCFSAVVSGLSGDDAGTGYGRGNQKSLELFISENGYSEKSMGDGGYDDLKPFQSILVYDVPRSESIDHVSIFVGKDRSGTPWTLSKGGYRPERSDGSLHPGNRYRFKSGARYNGFNGILEPNRSYQKP